MKLTPEAARKVVWDALFKHDGNRSAAAKELGVSMRTFYRYLSELELHEMVQKMGWRQHAGPPIGSGGRGGGVIQERILLHIRKHRGAINYGDLAVEIYGEDNRETRTRIYTRLDHMKRGGVLRHEDEKWKIISDAGVLAR